MHHRMTTWLTLFGVCLSICHAVQGQNPMIPQPLLPWQDWVTWQDPHRNCPTPYFSHEQHYCFWPSRMTLNVNGSQGTWEMNVNVYAETWIPLPGSADAWPAKVQVNGEPIAVVERDHSPAVQLPPGTHNVTGEFSWDVMPERIAIPHAIGILALTVNGTDVPAPTWDPNGDIWLQRARTEGTERDSLTAQVYRVIEDGIPLWLRTEVELTVSGKSREEVLGSVLPEGWILSSVESPIPVAVDDSGRMKAQVRAGRWNILLHAFRTDDAQTIQFAADARPIVASELIGFQANPEFRLAEIQQLPSMDVTQTTFPEKWRGLPVFLWDTKNPFLLVQKLRGKGGQRPEGLSVQREWWLDEDGGGYTSLDRIQANLQEISRLDATEGLSLGAVRINGVGQLITENPATGAHGVEIRTRNLKVEAIGRMSSAAEQPATGWQTSVDSLALTLNLPPGWRLLALFGADQVEGDWLTAWTLLDLFLLLIFSLAVFRLWGFWAGLIAFFAYGLAYQEFGAPRLTWLFVLMPVALLRVVRDGTAHRWIRAWKWIATALLVLCLLPFVATQIQSAIYPQLERPGIHYGSRGMFQLLELGPRPGLHVAASAKMLRNEVQQVPEEAVLDEAAGRKGVPQTQPSRLDKANLAYDPRERIQTGPADPQWKWIQANCRWNGPVAPDQTIQAFLVSVPVHRLMTVIRLFLLLLLAVIVLGVKRTSKGLPKPTAAVLMALVGFGFPLSANGQFPDSVMLDGLRERLLTPSDAYPRAADIPRVDLQLKENTLRMRAEIHTAIDVAVPLPGRLPAWSPLTVTIDGQPATSVCRRDGFLWAFMPKGVHSVVVEGLLPNAAEWDWSFHLKPRRVAIDAPGWTVTGVRANGVPDDQVFFARQQEALTREADYDRKEFQSVVVVDRHVEAGLVWQARTEVTRLSATGKALSLKVPLLPGERVLNADAVIEDGAIVVALSAGQSSVQWQSELPIGAEMRLRAAKTNQWVERWHLVTSPVWNVAVTGLAPVFASQTLELIPVWHPWPGEEVVWHFARPVPVKGETMTVKQVSQTTSLGARQSTHQMQVSVECSLGDDLVLELEPEAEITSLQRDRQRIPVRREDSRLLVPIQPGHQVVEVGWLTAQKLGTIARAGRVTLPITGSNITTILQAPESRWILWAQGPQMGPAVRFWIIVPVAILAAIVLGCLPGSPLRIHEWVLLSLGLTQVDLVPAMIVVGWLFLLAWRGRQTPSPDHRWSFNLMQVFLVLMTFVVLCILVSVVRAGLLGQPEMFIVGNGSSQVYLQWFQPATSGPLPQPWVVSVSLWYYRLLMLLWALWLASALLRWLVWGWQQFSHGGGWQKKHALQKDSPAAPSG